MSTSMIHHVIILRDGRCICDCGFPTNMGMPCRHIYRVLQALRDIAFHISLIRPRWYVDPTIDVDIVPAVLLNSTIPVRNRENANFADIPPILRNNPLGSLASTAALPRRGDSQPPPSTQTLSSRDVYHEVQAAIKPILSTVQTRGQLSNLVGCLLNTQREQEKLMNEGRARDPVVIRHKGGPRTTRISSAREGAPRGGGGRRTLRHRPAVAYTEQDDDSDEHADRSDDGEPPRKKARTRSYKCGLCHQEGHNRHTCPTLRDR